MSAVDLPAPWGSVIAAMEAGARLADTRYYDLKGRCDRQAEDIEALHAENAELRDGLTALSNRLEAATKGTTERAHRLDELEARIEGMRT